MSRFICDSNWPLTLSLFMERKRAVRDAVDTEHPVA
jgi:hypothetical protein